MKKTVVKFTVDVVVKHDSDSALKMAIDAAKSFLYYGGMGAGESGFYSAESRKAKLVKESK